MAKRTDEADRWEEIGRLTAVETEKEEELTVKIAVPLANALDSMSRIINNAVLEVNVLAAEMEREYDN